jgi:hypothetical protein
VDFFGDEFSLFFKEKFGKKKFNVSSKSICAFSAKKILTFVKSKILKKNQQK